MTKRYTVISQLTKRGPEYRIFDQLNNVTIEGDWKCEKWAQRQADLMEDKWRHERHREQTQRPARKQ